MDRDIVAVSRRPVITEVRVRSKVVFVRFVTDGVVMGHIYVRIIESFSRYHSSNAVNRFTDQSPALCNLSYLQCR